MTTPSAALGSVPKDGRTAAENDDRAAAGQLRYAVADGATDSGRAGVWAEILAAGFVLNWPVPVRIFDTRTLDRLRVRWRRTVYRDTLPWHAIWKLDRDPAAAAFAGVELDPPSRSYDVVAVGDCCVFHIRRRKLVDVGPIDDWRKFTSRPDLVKATRGEESHRAALWQYHGTYEHGDLLVLATDALSKYLLRRYERTGEVDIDECDVGSDHFADWVVGARGTGELDNDDTTACVVTL